MGPLTQDRIRLAFQALDSHLSRASVPTTLIMGGGGAMILAHGFPLGTSDVDAIPKGPTIEELDHWVKEVDRELGLNAPDWLNPYFATFSHTLPSDYGIRLISVFEGAALKVLALGADEMLIMKCFAHRPKDVAHARALIRKKANLDRVEKRIEELLKKGIPGAQQALDFFQDVLEQEEGD
jgi:Nucleotidyltransferase of unknown function (DUF6036)